MLTLCKDCKVVLEATILLEMAPRATWSCRTAAGSPEPLERAVMTRPKSLRVPSAKGLCETSILLGKGSDAVNCREAVLRRAREWAGRRLSEVGEGKAGVGEW